ncbi:presqualene diphosphate synthase HpnD [Acidisphaera sp. L21]|uniref:presqualene diphosphate synthase HpnD n=1 Tax=Acidisphaera sp. L21 TaxID=1641851 RepID=UPI00131E8948|nr:presqualene diphosphate synthase HpnD [Acidisphaera sp. L21]
MAAVNPLGAPPEDLAAVEAIVKAAGTSFYRGMRILPPDRRMAMYAIYAFCRLVDDVADEEAPIEAKHAGLQQWRQAISDVYAGHGHDAVTRVLVAAVKAFGLRQEDFLAVIDGMQMDADTVIAAPDFATLDLYCDRVAAAVGRLSVRAFGDGSARADEVAFSLGRALQLTNILRDLDEDAGRDRLYLPREWLDDAGVPHEPRAALASPHLPVVCDRMLAEARRRFGLAHTAMAQCDQKAMRPARLMGATYSAILDMVEKRGWAALDQPVKVPKWRKLAIVARHLL